jgi:hypothetical protein
MPVGRRTDFWFSVGLIAFAVAVTFESWRMPRLENLGINPMSAPGLTPGLIGIVLLVLGLALFFRSAPWKAGAPVAKISADGPSSDPSASFRLPLTMTLCLVYALGLVGQLPFLWSTSLFVFAFVGIFAFDRARPVRSLVSAAVMAIFVAVTVSLLFERVFLVRLP